jgi:integrase
VSLRSSNPGLVFKRWFPTRSRSWSVASGEQAYSPSVFNNTLGTLRSVLEGAGIAREETPAFKIRRVGVRPKELKLPEPKQFAELLETIQGAGARQSRHCADFVRFLAYSGCRLSEARQVAWRDVDLERGELRVQTAKRRKVSTATEVRYVPIIPPMLPCANYSDA